MKKARKDDEKIPARFCFGADLEHRVLGRNGKMWYTIAQSFSFPTTAQTTHGRNFDHPHWEVLFLKNLLELLDRTAARLPDAPAFCDEETSITWSGLQKGAAAVGTALARQGAQGCSVALYLDHEVSCILGMMGTLAAGGFYTVLDIAQPAERIHRITNQLQPAVLLTDVAHLEAARALGVGKTVLTVEEAAATEMDEDLLQGIRAAAVDTDLAYVLFTSGSTGLPKGVAITHRNVLAYSEWAVETFGFGPHTVLGNQTPFYFSMSVTDIYGALRSGACVQILPRRFFSFPVQLLDYLTTRRVNTIYWVPSALGIVANWKALDYTTPPPLRTILFAGEVMPTAKLNYWRFHYPQALFANLYGPTETTDICAYYVVDRDFADDEPLPIGRACANCGLLVLRDGKPVPAGEEGELCARGSFLAAGYYGLPEKTAERFCQNPLQTAYPETIYRTGDLVRYNDRGELIYCGRMDHQIKHMGYRIEPGEIETAAFGQDKLDNCACLFDQQRDRLVLFYQGKRDLTDALRERLSQRLPPYMRPAVYHRLKLMPQNQNGKIDRIALGALLADLP